MINTLVCPLTKFLTSFRSILPIKNYFFGGFTVKIDFVRVFDDFCGADVGEGMGGGAWAWV
jgi:hypothetical protein